MTDKARDIPDKQGRVGEAKGGRPPGAKNKIRSPLRKTQREIEKFEVQALKNIERSVNGEEVDKEVLTTSKWVINTKITISRAATAEEQLEHGIRQTAEPDTEVQEEEDEQPKVKFSLHVLPTAKDLEDKLL